MNPWVTVTGWALIHFVWQGALIALAVATALRLARGRSPEIRYVIACAGLAVMVVSPVLTARNVAATLVVQAPADPAGLDPVSDVAPLVIVREPKDARDATSDSGVVGSAAFAPWLTYIVGTWVVGVCVLLARFAGGSWRVHRLRRAATTSNASPWQAVANGIGTRLGIRVQFRVVESAGVDAPAAVGWIRPLILLPLAAAANLAPAQMEAILAHELAHVRRRDYIVNLLQTLAETALFYHPGVWWVSARIREEREHCCDDLAVKICGEPIAYAAALVEIASCRRRRTALAVGAAGGSLLARVRRVLRVPPDDEPRSTAGLLALALGLVVFAGIALHPLPGAEGSATPAQSRAANWRTQTTDHFDVQYEADLDLHAERVAQEAERAYERVSSDLKHSLAFRVPVIVLRTTTELQQSAQLLPPHVASSSDPARDRILLAIDRPAGEWQGLLTHEVAHVFAFDIIPGSTTPLWIAEGLAEYLRGEWEPGDLVAIREIVRANKVPTLSSLDGGADGTAGRVAYGIGHAAFEFIESRWGKEGVRRFMFGLRQAALKGTDAYQQAFEISRSEFAAAFDAYLRARFANVAGQSMKDRFDTAKTVEVEGALMAISDPVVPGLACLELSTTRTENGERWAVECGDSPLANVLGALKLGDRVILKGSPARHSATRRILIRALFRPSDGFTWGA